MIHSVVSSISLLLAKLSLPLMVTPFSAGGVTSRTTCWFCSMTTLSPATGTLRLGQVAGSDQFIALAAGAPAFWACITVNAPTSRDAVVNDVRKSERFLLLMTGT